MKRSVAAVLGLVVAGAAGFGIYEATSSSSPTPVRSSSPSPSPLASPSSATPLHAPTENAASPADPAAQRAPTSAPAAPSLPQPSGGATTEGDTPSAAVAKSAPPEPHSTRAFRERGAFQPGGENATQQQRLNARFEAAACKAPGIEERYRNLPPAERAKLKARCTKVGVILADPAK